MVVEREPYYGKCLVGNACHTILKQKNIEILCNAIPSIVEAETDDALLHANSVDTCSKFRHLLLLYSACHQMLNSSLYLLLLYSACHQIFHSSLLLGDSGIKVLAQNIITFMEHFRITWPNERITPKMHILEDHVVEFIIDWKIGCGFYGEQGGEAVHQEFNKMSSAYNNIKNNLDRLRYKMDMHMLSTAPKAGGLKVEKRPRNLKRKTIE